MNHITKEQVLELYSKHKIHDKYQGADRHTALCNAAIELYKNSQNLDTSAERVQKSEKSEQVPLTNGEIYTVYIEATNQTLRPQDERLVFAFARAVEKHHGIGGKK